MNTGAEAVETALKLCRRWAYEKKGVPENDAQIIVCENNFHGRTTTIISFSNDPVARSNFGPFTKGFIKVAYDDLDALEALAEVLIYAGKPTEGRTHAERAMRLNPTIPANALYLIGLSHFASGNPKEAATFVERALRHARGIGLLPEEPPLRWRCRHHLQAEAVQGASAPGTCP